MIKNNNNFVLKKKKSHPETSGYDIYDFYNIIIHKYKKMEYIFRMYLFNNYIIISNFYSMNDMFI